MLLFDQNLSLRLVGAIHDLFPGSIHVQDVGLSEAEDTEVWSYAIEKSLAIITKDGDFRQRSFLEGYPPKIIWVALGNCSTAAIENLIRARSEEIASFLSDGGSSFLSLS